MERLTLVTSKSHVIGLPTHQNCVNTLPIISQDGGRLGTRHQPIDRIIRARNIVVQAVRDAESNLSHNYFPAEFPRCTPIEGSDSAMATAGAPPTRRSLLLFHCTYFAQPMTTHSDA